MSRTQNLVSAEPVPEEESLAKSFEDADADAACKTMLLILLLPRLRSPCSDICVRLGTVGGILLVPSFRCIPIVVRSGADENALFRSCDTEHRRREDDSDSDESDENPATIVVLVLVAPWNSARSTIAIANKNPSTAMFCIPFERLLICIVVAGTSEAEAIVLPLRTPSERGRR
jgi:hypothetical protein